jgi:glycosyltransferase involved in cell wall biosynthesis
MISDWTVDYFLRFCLKREPGFFERRALARDDRQIEATDVVFSIFPGIAEYLKNKYKNKNIFYLGNAVNTLHTLPDNIRELILAKKDAHKLLFIGGKKYLDGLRTLINACTQLRAEFDNLSIHIIGMTRQDFSFDINYDKVFFYGYLNKDLSADNITYYKLLTEATAYINTTPVWSSFQAPVEALYFYTPIIISPNQEFFKIFGTDIEKCCMFCKDNSPILLAKYIKDILSDINYYKRSEYSHTLVKNFTWDYVADNFLETIFTVF